MIDQQEVEIFAGLSLQDRRNLFRWFSKEEKSEMVSKIVERERRLTAPLGSIVMCQSRGLCAVVGVTDFIRIIHDVDGHLYVAYYSSLKELE